MTARRMLFGGGAGPFSVASIIRVVEELTTGDQAGYCWFNDPRALRKDGVLYFGNIDPAGNVECRSLDEVTGVVSAPAVTYPAFEADDHDNPGFLIRASDGVIMCFFTIHVGDVYCTTAPSADVAGLTLANTANITGEVGGRSGGAGYTYASPFQLTGEAGDPIYLSFRYHNAPSGAVAFHGLSKSVDGGVSWTDTAGNPNAHTLMVQVTYHHAVQNGDDRIDFAYSNHPDDPDDHGVYHVYYQGGNLYKTDGTLVGVPGAGGAMGGAYALADISQVFAAAGGEIAWIWDIAIDPDTGFPVIVYIVYGAPYPTGPWRYERAHWTGSAWVRHTVADAGSKFPTTTDFTHGGQYAGGIAVDQFNPDVVYYGSNAGGGDHKMYLAVTADNGATWSPVTLSDGSDKAVRPIAVRGEPGRTQVIWEHGSYFDYFGNYAMDIAAWR